MKTREIADFLSAELKGSGDVEIKRVAAVATATIGDIAFLERTETDVDTNASCLIVPNGFSTEFNVPYIKTANPKLSFALVGALLPPPKEREPEIHNSAVISDTARIGKDVFIGAFTCVGENSSIGDGTQLRAGAKIGDNVTVGTQCTLHPNVFIEDGSNIGNNVVLHAGVIIGASGFGYVPDEKGEYHQFPQIGKVVIEDNVEIGANTCVDRGALGDTRIGAGTKIDNLVQIAHNVQIGKRVVIAAQTGISGSTVIEDDCVIGGQVGMGD